MLVLFNAFFTPILIPSPFFKLECFSTVQMFSHYIESLTPVYIYCNLGVNRSRIGGKKLRVLLVHQWLDFVGV